MQLLYLLLVFTVNWAAPVFSNSAGAPLKICDNNLVPEHHVEPQSSAVPYKFNGVNAVKAGGQLPITLTGGDVGFLGFALQARDAYDNPVGQFKVVDAAKSQALSCKGGVDNTLTHKKIPRDFPITSVNFVWIAPETRGKVKLVGTVAQNGGTYWVRKVLKEVDVQ